MIQATLTRTTDARADATLLRCARCRTYTLEARGYADPRRAGTVVTICAECIDFAQKAIQRRARTLTGYWYSYDPETERWRRHRKPKVGAVNAHVATILEATRTSR